MFTCMDFYEQQDCDPLFRLPSSNECSEAKLPGSSFWVRRIVTSLGVLGELSHQELQHHVGFKGGGFKKELASKCQSYITEVQVEGVTKVRLLKIPEFLNLSQNDLNSIADIRQLLEGHDSHVSLCTIGGKRKIKNKRHPKLGNFLKAHADIFDIITNEKTGHPSARLIKQEKLKAVPAPPIDVPIIANPANAAASKDDENEFVKSVYKALKGGELSLEELKAKLPHFHDDSESLKNRLSKCISIAQNDGKYSNDFSAWTPLIRSHLEKNGATERNVLKRAVNFGLQMRIFKKIISDEDIFFSFKSNDGRNLVVLIEPAAYGGSDIPLSMPQSVRAAHSSYPKAAISEKNFTYVSTETELQAFLLQWKLHRDGLEEIALDCEGVRLSKKGKLCLVQICYERDGRIWTYLFDCIVLKDVVETLDNVGIFQDSGILRRFVHDSRKDFCALLHQYKIPLANVVDTQLLHESLTLEHQVGFNTFLKSVGMKHEVKDQIKKMYSKNAAIWSHRPLTPLLQEYAAMDVCLLLDAVKRLNVNYNIIENVQSASEIRNLAAFQGTGRHICFTTEYKLRSVYLTPRSQQLPKRMPKVVETESEVLFKLLPSKLVDAVSDTSLLREFVLDLGHYPIAYLTTGKRIIVDTHPLVDLALLQKISDGLHFGSDGRAGIDGCLHRISAIRNLRNVITGLTLRVGRTVENNASMISDYLHTTEKSILVLGPPGTGKTTVIRSIARELSDAGDNVLIVDTSNEIGGDGDILHPSLGLCRRMMVPCLSEQSRVMIEGLQNHTPDTMVIDEIGRPEECNAARTIRYRGVRLIGSAHGSFQQLMRNNDLKDLLGSFETATVSDRTAQETNQGRKTKVERVNEPCFDVIIQLHQDYDKWTIIDDVRDAVDSFCRHKPIVTQTRTRKSNGEIYVKYVKIQ